MAYTPIDKSDEYFNTKLYTGTGATQSITGVGFQPDWVWIKGRSGATDHGLYDAVRGVQKQLESNTTTAETTEATGLTAFGTDGFTVGALAQLNTSTATYVAWNWLGANTTVSNTSGTITSTVSANTTSGFSIVSYTATGANATVGHGLGVAPKMIIVRSRTAVRNWPTYHAGLGSNTNFLYLNDIDASASLANMWNSTTPTPTLFGIGTNVATNANTENYIAYCFAEKQGFSKFGSYTGNGSTDGTFIYTGFKPAFFVVKPYSTTGNWYCWDSKRAPINQIDGKYLELDASSAEVSTSGVVDLDFLSTGVKLRNTGGGFNGSGVSFIYIAFAENPFVTSTGIPTPAR
jgi:hypothetical protein